MNVFESLIVTFNKTGFSSDQLSKFASNSPLALTELPWERLKIGAGTPPVLTTLGWLLLYHGVASLVMIRRIQMNWFIPQG